MEKPLSTKNYGSIPHLSSSKLGTGDHFISIGQEKILTERARDSKDTIYSYEKYDGSNVGVCKVNNVVIPLTRSGWCATTSKYEQHHMFANWVRNNYSLFDSMLQNGERIVGEWMAQAHGMKYKITGNPILFFDYFNQNNQRLTQNILKKITGGFGLNMPRLLSVGEPVSLDLLFKKLSEKTNWCKSCDEPEGIVFRVERDDKVDFLAKWVRGDYKTGQYLNEDVWNDNELANI